MSVPRDTTMDVNMTAKDLLKIMKQHNISIETLSTQLGVTTQAVIYWMTDKRKIPEPIGRLLNLIDQEPKVLRDL